MLSAARIFEENRQESCQLWKLGPPNLSGKTTRRAEIYSPTDTRLQEETGLLRWTLIGLEAIEICDDFMQGTVMDKASVGVPGTILNTRYRERSATTFMARSRVVHKYVEKIHSNWQRTNASSPYTSSVSPSHCFTARRNILTKLSLKNLAISLIESPLPKPGVYTSLLASPEDGSTTISICSIFVCQC